MNLMSVCLLVFLLSDYYQIDIIQSEDGIRGLNIN